ncbi:MAG TPA: InlB B-repeat-containing protein, partial [Alphaproteobacteria bacterium]|nr:InlB B-repeat-containing protein [Alphaproteobacteria bacterium]
SKTITGCSVVTSQQVTYTGTSWPASTYYVSASGGYVVANNSTASATCNACSGSTYSTGGLSTSCTACLSNYTISGNTASDHDSVDDCKISCNAGTYIATANATTCTDVGNGYWVAATSDISQGTVSNREECPGGVYGHSSAPRDSINTCYAICNAGSYISSPGSNCQTLSDNDKYIIENYVYYGDVSTVSTCDTANGYHIINKILASDHDSMYDCYQSCFTEDITPPTGATKIPANESEYYPNYCVYIASCPAGYDPIASGDFYDDSGYTTDPYCNANLMNITFDANGGTITDGGTTYEKTCLIGSSCVLNDTTLGRFQKTGYVFGGWSKTQSGSAVYQNNSDIGSSETSDLTLFAVWNQCAAGYVWNGSSCSACPVGSWKSGITAASGSAMTCTACAAGTTTAGIASTSSTACTSCPMGSFCSADGSSMTSCSTLGDGSWTLSETGAQTSNQCYKNCPSYSVVYGTAMTDTGNAFYPNDCQYYCISETGNRGEVQAGKCVEKSCKNTFEMIGGVCQSCNRENAISYKTTGNCEIDSCASGYHPNGQSCEENIIECDAPNADESKKTWNSSKGSFSTCKIITCSYGYHLSSNACVADEQTCAIENGLGTKTWDDSKNVWGPCNVTSCNPGYTSEYSETNEHTKPCGTCKNKYSILGEVAVSSYSRECEIASCMYQGELYNLENNECVPICDVAGYEDDTGTMKWNSSTKKCERQCKDGYTSWPSYSLPSTKIPDTSHS